MPQQLEGLQRRRQQKGPGCRLLSGQKHLRLGVIVARTDRQKELGRLVEVEQSSRRIERHQRLADRAMRQPFRMAIAVSFRGN